MTNENLNNEYPGTLEPRFVLSSLKKILYGNQQEPRIDYIDSALARISSQILNKNSRNYAELMRTAFTKTLEREDFNTLPGTLTNDLETLGRITRYINASEIVDGITYCARALKVLTDGIISPDDITKKSIQVLPETQSSEENNDQIELIKNIIKKLKIDTLVWTIVYETLKNGDQFVEICDYKSADVPITQSLLTEGFKLSDEDLKILEDSTHVLSIDESYLNELEETKREITINLQFIIEKNADENQIIKILTEENNEDEGDKKNKKYTFSSKDRKTEISDIRILLHNPRNVIKIQSKRHRMCLGYLILPEFDSGYNPFIGSDASPSKSMIQFGLTSLMPNSSIVTGIDSLYRDMMSKIKKYAKNDDIFINKKEVMALLTRSISEIDMDDHDSKNVPFKVRFVPVERMEHFMISSQRFFPYGEGIFYKSTFQSKLLIALETAITIKRISDSVDKRVMYIESGLPRDARTIIEELKTAFKKRKFSIDTLGTVGTVPSSITAYEDIYVPQSRGKRFVEFDTLQSNVQIRDVVEELKYFRDTIVAGLDVPPAYLNLEENLSNKSALTFENGIFSQTIVAYQYVFSEILHSFLSKITQLLNGFKIKDTITITFPPPKMLQMERDAEKFDMVARIVQALSDMGVDREWAVRKYIDLPWDDIEKYSNKSDIDNKLEPPGPEDNMMGAAGGMGGMPMM